MDNNAGKLARWLRAAGYDSLYFRDGSDNEMLKRAQAENRILLTRDTRIIKRKVAAAGIVKVILLKDDAPEKQLRQVVNALNLGYLHKPFSLCLECNLPLVERKLEEVRDMVPPYVFKTQRRYFQCPSCRRIYWGGSHKHAMEQTLRRLASEDRR